jgi:hypothetical protein
MKIWVDASFVFNHLEVYFQSRLAILRFSNDITGELQVLRRSFADQ